MKNGIITQLREKRLQVQAHTISQLQEAQALKFYPPTPLLILWHESGRAKRRGRIDEYMNL
jgi:hypothetical protein